MPSKSAVAIHHLSLRWTRTANAPQLEQRSRPRGRFSIVRLRPHDAQVTNIDRLFPTCDRPSIVPSDRFQDLDVVERGFDLEGFHAVTVVLPPLPQRKLVLDRC